MRIYVLHGDRNHATGQYDSASLVARMHVDDEGLSTEQALEQAYRYTNNINGSWSLKIGHDAHPDIAVLHEPHCREGRFMGLRSTMVGDLMAIADDDQGALTWYEVDDVGFTAFDPTDTAFTFERRTGSFLQNINLPHTDTEWRNRPSLAGALAAQLAVFFGVKDANMAEQTQIKSTFFNLLDSLTLVDERLNHDQLNAAIELFQSAEQKAASGSPGFNQSWLDHHDLSAARAIQTLTDLELPADTAYEALVNAAHADSSTRPTKPIIEERAPISLFMELQQAGISSDQLDGLVHDAAERVASRVNNEGMQEQLEFLEQNGFSDEEIRDELGLDAVDLDRSAAPAPGM